MRSTSMLSSGGGCLSRYALIRIIQSYAGYYASSSITINSGFALQIDSSGFTKGLDNLPIITSSGVGAWRKQSRPDDQHCCCPNVGHTVLQTYRKTSPSCALLLDI
jgi:hypothetical protein